MIDVASTQYMLFEVLQAPPTPPHRPFLLIQETKLSNRPVPKIFVGIL